MILFDDDPVPSPCVSICKMDPRAGTAAERAAGGLCVGCLRTLDEIIAWGSAEDADKRDIVTRVETRRSRPA